MSKVNIISGFLGAGKTTFIKRLISDVFKGEKLVLIENEFGEIGVDGNFLQDSGIEITEMNSGCICCSLVGDFTKALEETVKKFSPDRIIIEPSGVGKLSDVIAAVNNTDNSNIKVDSCITVADATKCKLYRKNFGEFYEDQILYSNCVLLTRTDKASEDKIEQAMTIIKEINNEVNIITTHLDLLSREQILDAFNRSTIEKDLLEEAIHAHIEHEHDHNEHCKCHGHGHHKDHHEHDEHCECHKHEHHHEHDEYCECNNHEHHHEHDEHRECHKHEHHHKHDDHCECHGRDHHNDHHHDDNCTCGSHTHDHHHHHADETFTSWGIETVKNYTEEELNNILKSLDSGEYGMILRAKGMVSSGEKWLYFDYVPEESSIRSGMPCFTGKICVIGADLNEDLLMKLFTKTL